MEISKHIYRIKEALTKEECNQIIKLEDGKITKIGTYEDVIGS